MSRRDDRAVKHAVLAVYEAEAARAALESTAANELVSIRDHEAVLRGLREEQLKWSRKLAARVVRAREAGATWAELVEASGKSRQYLQRMIARPRSRARGERGQARVAKR